MMYKIKETLEAINDVTNHAKYIIDEFKNHKAALDFLDNYDKEIQKLKTFPFGYRKIGFEYRDYEIRLKPYDSYNIFFIADMVHKEIVILRILKDREEWQVTLQYQSEYRF